MSFSLSKILMDGDRTHTLILFLEFLATKDSVHCCGTLCEFLMAPKASKVPHIIYGAVIIGQPMRLVSYKKSEKKGQHTVHAS